MIKDYFKTVFTKKTRSVKVGAFSVINKDTILQDASSIGKFNQFRNATLGSFSYIGDYCILNDVSIGRYCSLGSGIEVVSGNHPTNYVSTSPCFYSVRKQCGKTFVSTDSYNEYTFVEENKVVVIENDVWIGNDAMLMAGVRIGNGAVIGARALVTKDILPYEVVGGVPAKVIKKRFGDSQIKWLLESQWWNWKEKEVLNNIDKMKDIEKFVQYVKERLDENIL